VNDFDDILHHLGALLGIPLVEDVHHSCCLYVANSLRIFLEFEESRHRLLLGSLLGNIQAGAFRESVLKHCLKENGKFPRIATFGFSQKHNEIALFQYLERSQFQHELALRTEQFVIYALKWKEAIEKGAVDLPSGLV